MSKGGYIGGSTVIRAFPAKGRPRTKGLLALEVQFEKTGSVAKQSLLPAPAPAVAKTKSKKRKRPSQKVPPTMNAARVPAPSEMLEKRPAPGGPVGPNSTGKYSADETAAFLMRYHPKCPKPARQQISKIVAQGRWSGMTLGAAVASGMEHYLTYQVCGLQKLIDFGLDRERTIEMVSFQVKAVLALWGGKPVWTK